MFFFFSAFGILLSARAGEVGFLVMKWQDLVFLTLPFFCQMNESIWLQEALT